MKKAIFAALCLSGTLAFATGASAQDSTANSDEKGQKHTMTVTGCLREAPGAAGEYELTNAGGEKGSTAGSAATSTYKLTATSSVNLKEHVGHKVEIKGTMSGSEKSPTSTATSGMEKLEVTSLKHISPTCEAGK